jgi:hypothetical protein
VRCGRYQAPRDERSGCCLEHPRGPGFPDCLDRRPDLQHRRLDGERRHGVADDDPGPVVGINISRIVGPALGWEALQAQRALGRATSVVSYTIANLEAQLGVSLFDREVTRKPQLTEAGRTVLFRRTDRRHPQKRTLRNRLRRQCSRTPSSCCLSPSLVLRSESTNRKLEKSAYRGNGRPSTSQRGRANKLVSEMPK